MRFSHIARLTAAAAVAAIAVAGCGASDGGSDSSSSSDSKCGLKIGFFGALTGDAANLGKNIQNGAKLAVDQYNVKNADCKVELAPFDSQGDPAQASGLAQKAITDTKIVGIVGPAFSGESKVADPLFNQAGIATITPSATNPALADNGWKTFFRILGNDNTQGPAASKYIKDTLKATKVAVVDDASEYGKGLATIVKSDLGSSVVATDTVQQKQTDFAPTAQKIKSSGATAVFFGGYYAEAGLLRKQMTDADLQAVTLVVGDGVKDEGFIKAAGAAAAEGTVMTCPCLPPSKASGTFAADYQKAFGAEAGTYGAEGFDSANVFLAGIADGKTTRAAMVPFVKGFTGTGASKEIAFDAKGEVTNKVVWAYKVTGGKIVEDQEIK